MGSIVVQNSRSVATGHAVNIGLMSADAKRGKQFLHLITHKIQLHSLHLPSDSRRGSRRELSISDQEPIFSHSNLPRIISTVGKTLESDVEATYSRHQ